jgi:lipoyl(octanoyl) transferase
MTDTQPIHIPESFPLTKWRLIQTPPTCGAWNMALDEALLEGMAENKATPILRLYAWEPACLSLGYAQPFQDVDMAALARNGWDIVRRPTGGRAILHTDELTYAVIAPHSEPRLAGGVLESYQRLSAALLDALHRIQVPAAAQTEAFTLPENQPTNRNAKGPVCFEVPSNYEITVDGRKLIGSAQARRREGVLQHGTLPLFGDLKRILSVLVFENETERQAAARRLLSRAATVADSLGVVISWETAAQAMRAAFQEVLQLKLVPSSPSLSERQRAEELVAEKYASEAWTKRT